MKKKLKWDCESRPWRKPPFDKDLLWIGALFIVYLSFLLPTINIYPEFSIGDMGRDAYAFWVTLEGQLPCRDYWWQYGPSMILYYAFWLLMLGVNLVSLKIGLSVLLFLCALVTFATLRLFTDRIIAFLFSLAFLRLNLGWTFNHVGCFPFLLMIFFSLWKFYRTQRKRWCYLGVLAVIAISSVKITAGLASFVAFFLSLLLYRRPASKHLFLITLIFGTSVSAIYGLLYAGIPLYRIDQCLTISAPYRFKCLYKFDINHPIGEISDFFNSPALQWNLILLTIFIIGIAATQKEENLRGQQRLIRHLIGSCVLFGAINSLDYFVDCEIGRIQFWSFPEKVLLMGLSTQWASSFVKHKYRFACHLAICLVMLWPVVVKTKTALALRVPERYLNFGSAKVYVGGNLDFTKNVISVTKLIIKNTIPSDEIIVMPYYLMYCFLSGRRHAIPETAFVPAMSLPEEQQYRMIKGVREKNVSLILMLNVKPTDSGEGCVNTSEKIYGDIFTKYISENFEEMGANEVNLGGSGSSEIGSCRVSLQVLKRRQ